MPKSLPVAICMRNRLVRESIAQLLRTNNFNIKASIDCVEGLVGSSIKSDAELIIVYVGTEGRQTSIDRDAIIQIRLSYPRSRIVLLLDDYRSEHRWQAERLGIAGVLSQSISREVFIASLNLIALGEHVFSAPPSLADPTPVLTDRSERYDEQIVIMPGPKDVDAPSFRAAPEAVSITVMPQPKLGRRSELSERELEILTFLVAGNSNKMIARLCKITEATVKVHLKAILRKTEVANRTQAAVWALNNVDLKGRAAFGQALAAE